MTSSKPYLIRAIYEWIIDNNMTPHLVVDVAYPETRVPDGYAENGRIVLNIAPGAVQGLAIANDWIEFNARFGGVARSVVAPAEAVLGIFARENGQGMVFPDPVYPEAAADSGAAKKPGAPKLRSVKTGKSAGKPRLSLAGGQPDPNPDPDPPSPGAPKKKGRGAPNLKIVN